jgi:hypothetical protein
MFGSKRFSPYGGSLSTGPEPEPEDDQRAKPIGNLLLWRRHRAMSLDDLESLTAISKQLCT